MKKLLIMTIVNIRWFYFHISPMYVKFYMDSERTEAHFQHIKTGQLHCNYSWSEE